MAAPLFTGLPCPETRTKIPPRAAANGPSPIFLHPPGHSGDVHITENPVKTPPFKEIEDGSEIEALNILMFFLTYSQSARRFLELLAKINFSHLKKTKSCVEKMPTPSKDHL